MKRKFQRSMTRTAYFVPHGQDQITPPSSTPDSRYLEGQWQMLPVMTANAQTKTPPSFKILGAPHISV